MKVRTIFYFALAGIGAYAGWLLFDSLSKIPYWEGDTIQLPLFGDVELALILFPIIFAIGFPLLAFITKEILKERFS